MEYIDFRGTKLSRLALGTVQFGIPYGIANNTGQPDIAIIQKIINYVTQKGINCFDTARSYGIAEDVLGQTLPHTKTFIVSKIASKDFKTNAFQNVQKSLQKLHQKKLFALLLHDCELLHNWDESCQQIATSLQNKTDFFGVSIYTNEEFELAMHNDSIDIIQIPFNLFDQRAQHLGWIEQAKNHKKLLFIRSIYLQGLLLMPLEDAKKKLPEAYPYLQQLHQFVHSKRCSLQQLAMQYVYTVAHNSILLFGCETLTQAHENITLFQKLEPLHAQEVDKLHSLFSDIGEKIYNPSKW